MGYAPVMLTSLFRPGLFLPCSAHFFSVSAHFVFTSGQICGMLWADKLVSIQ